MVTPEDLLGNVGFGNAGNGRFLALPDDVVNAVFAVEEWITQIVDWQLDIPLALEGWLEV